MNDNIETWKKPICILLLLLPRVVLSQTSILQSTTQLVQMDVVVLNKDGTPIPGLTKEDFTVKDQGKQQRIKVFVAYEKDRTAELKSTSKVASGTFTNSNWENPASATIVLIDALNSSFIDNHFAHVAVRTFLSALRPDDHVGLYSFDGQIRIFQDVTSDSRQLLAALGKGKQILSPDLDYLQPPPGPLDSFLNLKTADIPIEQAPGLAGSIAAQSYFQIEKQRKTLLALRQVADHLRSFPGRKDLVWLSGSFPVDFRVFGSSSMRSLDPALAIELDRTLHILSAADIAVSPVNAQGLVVGLGFDASNAVGPIGPGKALRTPDNHLGMIYIARQTGGTAYYDLNDLESALRKTLEQSRLNYKIGWYPTHQDVSSFHTVNIDVKRKGLTVRHKKGYFFNEAPSLDAKATKDVWREAILSPLEETGIELHAKLLRPPKSNFIRLAVSLRGIASTRGDVFNVCFAERDAKGKEFMTETRFEHELAFTEDVQLVNDVKELRFVVFSPARGQIGTLFIPLAWNLY